MSGWQADAVAALGCDCDPGPPLAFADQVSAGEPALVAEIIGYSVMDEDLIGAMEELLTSHPFVARGGTLQINQAMA